MKKLAEEPCGTAPAVVAGSPNLGIGAEGVSLTSCILVVVMVVVAAALLLCIIVLVAICYPWLHLALV